jgi:hypothetical protein
MSVSTETETLVGKCRICEINVYDRGSKNKPFVYLGKQRMGYPRDVAMPCGLNRAEGRCPFESKQEQALIEYKKGQGIFSGDNLWNDVT